MANSTRKCCGCKERFATEEMIRLPAGWFHSMECSIQYAIKKDQAKRKRAQQKRRRQLLDQQKADRRDLMRRKQALKSKGDWMKEAQAAINLYVRLRDYFKPCISCGKPKEVIESEQGWKVGGCWDAGHFKSRGAKPQLRFYLPNINKQCKSCNGGGGKFAHKAVTVDAQYEINLIEKVGPERVEWIKNNNESERFTVEYFQRVKRIFTKKARMRKKRLIAMGEL